MLFIRRKFSCRDQVQAFKNPPPHFVTLAHASKSVCSRNGDESSLLWPTTSEPAQDDCPLQVRNVVNVLHKYSNSMIKCLTSQSWFESNFDPATRFTLWWITYFQYDESLRLCFWSYYYATLLLTCCCTWACCDGITQILSKFRCMSFSWCCMWYDAADWMRVLNICLGFCRQSCFIHFAEWNCWASSYSPSYESQHTPWVCLHPLIISSYAIAFYLNLCLLLRSYKRIAAALVTGTCWNSSQGPSGAKLELCACICADELKIHEIRTWTSQGERALQEE